MIDVREIMRLIPHRYPVLLVDSVEEFEKDVSIVGVKNVTFNEWFFQGHFPGNPIMPGVLTIEAMAQTAAILAMKSAEKKGLTVYFMSIEKAKFRRPVVPGDRLRMEVNVTHRRGQVWKFSAKALVEGNVASEAEFTAMMSEEGQ
jgi:3-hydroxyacyl-[acyl-carrier-protein] dehydratase